MNETLSHHINLLFDWRFADFLTLARKMQMYIESNNKNESLFLLTGFSASHMLIIRLILIIFLETNLML